MRELADHIQDIMQNSVEAGATEVTLEITEDRQRDVFIIRISDNGRGMDEAVLKHVTDPFVTSRRTRRVGLGLSLLEMTAKRSGGGVRIESAPGRGTVVEASYVHSHWDRPPLGNIAATIKGFIVVNPEITLNYVHSVDGKVFSFTSREIAAALGEEIPLTHPDVLSWLDSFLTGGISDLYGGARENEDR